MSEREGTAESPLLTERGRTTVKDTVVTKIAGKAAQEVPGVHLGGRSGGVLGGVTGSGGGQTRGISVTVGSVEAAIDLTMSIEHGHNILETVGEVRRRISESVERMTGLRITEMNATINDIVFPEDEQESVDAAETRREISAPPQEEPREEHQEEPPEEATARPASPAPPPAKDRVASEVEEPTQSTPTRTDSPSSEARTGDAPEESAPEEPASQEPTSQEPTSQEPTSEEPASEEPASEEPVSEEPASEEPTEEGPSKEETVEFRPGETMREWRTSREGSRRRQPPEEE